MSYERLDPHRVVETIRKLSQRIQERFPGAGLGQVCQHLLTVGEHARRRSDWIARPVWWLRAVIAMLMLAAVPAMGVSLLAVKLPNGRIELVDFAQFLESGINDLIFLGAGIFFLVTAERRIKRRRALKAIDELRALAHIIDMHQLSKNPERVQHRDKATASSPRYQMSYFELGRYLDYCTEMLSLTGKIAALLVQRFDDPVALEAASDVENLTTGLSRKIWQKILSLHSLEESGG